MDPDDWMNPIEKYQIMNVTPLNIQNFKNDKKTKSDRIYLRIVVIANSNITENRKVLRVVVKIIKLRYDIPKHISGQVII